MNKPLLYRVVLPALSLATLFWFLASPVTPALAAQAPVEVEGTVVDTGAIQASVIRLPAGSHRAMVNLRGDEVLIPTNVPLKDRYVLKRLLTVKDKLIVFLYSDPKFRRPVDYAETYNLRGELLEIAWYEPTEGVQRVRDVNLGSPDAKRPARILNFRQKRHELGQQPAKVIGNDGLELGNY